MSQESSSEHTATTKEKLVRLRERVKEELIKRLGEAGYTRMIHELQGFKRVAVGEPPPKTPEQINREVLDILGTTLDPSGDTYYAGIPGSMMHMGPYKILSAYNIIDVSLGHANAADFMQMIMDMQSLAPINILQALRRLMENNWIYESSYAKHVVEGTGTTHPLGNITHEATALGAYVARGMPDETEQIKAAIRASLGDTGKEDVRRVTIDSTPLV